MKRCLYPFLPLLLGLIIAQIIATFHVFWSNAALYQNLTLLKDAGYLVVPNEQIMKTLPGLGPAIWGGLFFALSVGAGLSFVCFCAAWIYDRLIRRSRVVLLSYIIIWVCLLVALNWRGLSWTNTAYFFLIPPAVFIVSLRRGATERKGGNWVGRLAGICSVVALAMLWSAQMDRQLFSDIRDHLLLSNPIGTKINNFYYRYTLHPAEVFKSLDQKLLKTCRVEHGDRSTVSRDIEAKLMYRDYLPVEASGTVDLVIHQDGDSLDFRREGELIHQASTKEFLARPGSVLHDVSVKSDRNGFFRQFTFLSLLIAFPLFLYVAAYSLFCLILSVFISYRSGSVVSTIICFVAGLGALFYFDWSRSMEIEKARVWDALASECRQKRVAALKLVNQERMDLTTFQDYRALLSSPHVSERIWAVKALGVSSKPKSFNHLVSLMNDPHPNVVSAVYSALSRRGDTRAVPLIIQKIKTSHHWYSQWHGYNALKALGWWQGKSR
jgi:hypothetical protein